MKRRRFLVAYDIRDQRRLLAVHKTVKAFGNPLQYSVFVCDLTEAEKIRLIQGVCRHMNQDYDSVVIIDLGAVTLERFLFIGERDLMPPSDDGPLII